MSLTRILRSSLAACGVLLAVASAASAQPSTIFNTYVLFAQDSLRIRGSTKVSDGDIGVNRGIMYLRGQILAPQSDLVADVVRLDTATDCEDLFANGVQGSGTSCPKAASPVPRPLFVDMAQSCGFPPPADLACASDPAADFVVSHDQTAPLAPGKYRNLVVEGGGEGPAVLKLDGNYQFCNVWVGRNGSIVFGGPSTVTISGNARMSNATEIGPDKSLGVSAPPPGAIKWFIGGSLVRFSRKGDVRVVVCAPNAKMNIGGGVLLEGRFVARSLRVKRAIVKFAGPVPGICGDTIVSPGEECETTAQCSGGQTCIACDCVSTTTTSTTTGSSTTTTLDECEDDDDCNEGSVGGGFVCENGHCVPECDDDEDCNQGSPGGGFVCVDGHCVPGGSSTSTTSVHTTTTIGGTTSTTLRPCTTTDDCPTGVCKDGVCVPECETDEDCRARSPEGSFVCIDQRCVPTHEVCDDCRDNDGDGLVDFEDADCCDTKTGQLFPMDLRKGKLRAHTSSQSTIRMKGTLARNGLGARIDPPAQQVTIQIRNKADGEVLCATVPAGKFLKKRNGFRFSRKRTPVPADVGRNLDKVQIKVRKNGEVRFKLKAKRAMLSTPAEGTLQVTVGFTRTGATATQNVCSQATRLFRGGKKNQLRFP